MSRPEQSSRPFLRACLKQPVDRVPIWMMRQAGRYQPEYRALKEDAGGFWGLCTSPKHLAEATLFAQRSLQTDAAIIFSDITVPAWAMGLPLEFVPGPKFGHATNTEATIDELKPLDPKKVDFLSDGIKLTREGLEDDIALIGFVGAPLTLAGYMIEGYPSRNWLELKKLAYGNPDLMQKLIDKVVDAVIAHARLQVEAGCDSIQLFDSTAGQLDEAALYRFAFESSARVIEGLKDLGVPIIYFARDIQGHLPKAATLGADVLGVDWAISIEKARKLVGDDVALMGNLDPGILFTDPKTIQARITTILDQARGLPGYIFNLGHGILPETPPEHAKLVVDTVHAYQR